MSEQDAIVARGLTKSYAAPDRRWLRRERIRGVTDVSFTLRRGGSLAIIGRNGAGKSTLLRMLAGLSRPTSGELRLEGRVGSLLDLGAGFVEEWSGEHNARVALALLGMSPSRVREAASFVAAFSELGDFLAQPVRIYSAGMRLRLAYSVAIAPRPEILIADEVLSVGDESFQRKCSQHIVEHLARGGTMVLATHNLYQAERLCDAAIWLEDGRVRAQGPCHDVTKRYRTAIEQAESVAHANAVARALARPGAMLRIDGAEIGDDGAVVPFGTALRIVIDGAIAGSERGRLEIRRVDGTLVASLPVRGSGTFEIARPALLPGRYVVRLIGRAGVGAATLDEVATLDELTVDCVGERRELGTVHLDHQWM
ncbi:MAG TPA: ABC transporter ATP-binding protein [Candidatus Binatia bacterium]